MSVYESASQVEWGAADSGARPRVLAGLCGLVLIAAAWSWSFSKVEPAQLFGQYHDDAMLMSSAQALAEGRGYLLPSVPGPDRAADGAARGLLPVQTKYPVFYPWLLSLVWKWNPSFPENLHLAVGLAAGFACLALLGSYLLLRSMSLGMWLAAAMTVFCAFHPFFLVYGARVMTDVPMMALTLSTAVLADRVLERRPAAWFSFLVGLLAAAATLTRSIGITIVLSFLGLALYRRRYRDALVFLAGCAPLVALGMLWPGNNKALEPWVQQGGLGFQQTWLYYTSYLGFWKLSVPDWPTFWQLISTNLFICVTTPATCFLFVPVGGTGSFAGMLIHLAVSLGVLAGIIRQARRHGWRVIHFIFFLESAIILLWNNVEMTERFFLPFLPLFCVGLWTEGRHLASLLTQSFQAAKPASVKALAGGIALGLVFILAWGARSYVKYRRTFIAGIVPGRVRIEKEKRELYAWLQAHSDPSARVIAWEDAELYLYSGRQGMRPIAFATQWFNSEDQRVLERDLEHLLDTARYIQARYWVRSEDEFVEAPQRRKFQEKLNTILQSAPVVFQSSQGRVRLYDISSLTSNGAAGS